MLSNLERIRSRALSFSSDNGANNNLEDLNALESVINENDLQPALKPSPLKASPGGLLKRRRRKHCVHDTSEKLQLLALHDDNVFETGSQDEDTADNRRNAEDFPLQQIDLSGQILRKTSKSRVASTRPPKYEADRTDHKALMSNVSRLIRERPVILPAANVKRFEDIDEYLSAYRQRKRERENRRNQMLSSTKASTDQPNSVNADPFVSAGDAGESLIDITPIKKSDGQPNALLKRLEQQVIRERNNSSQCPRSKGGQNRKLMREKLREQIEKHRQERLAKKAEAAKIDTQVSDLDKSADVKFYEPVEISSVTVSDTKTEDAIETAFKAIEVLGADTKEPSVSGSFTEQWTIESLETNALDPQAASKIEWGLTKDSKDSPGPSDDTTLANDDLPSPFSYVEPDRREISVARKIGDVKRPRFGTGKEEPKIEEKVDCLEVDKPEDKTDFVCNWLREQVPPEELSECVRSRPFEEDSETKVRYVSSDDDSPDLPDGRSDVEKEEKTPSELLPRVDSDAESLLEERKGHLLRKIAEAYIEDQAEQSGSDVSQGEDEDSVAGSNLDIIDTDGDDLEEEGYGGERNKVHIMREIAEDDKRLHALRERYLSKLEPTRQKRFRWNEDTVASDGSLSFVQQDDSSDNEATSSVTRDQLVTEEKSDMADVYNDNSVEKILNDKSFRLVKSTVDRKYEQPRQSFYKRLAAGFTAAKGKPGTITGYFTPEEVEEDLKQTVENTDSIFNYL